VFAPNAPHLARFTRPPPSMSLTLVQLCHSFAARACPACPLLPLAQGQSARTGTYDIDLADMGLLG